MNIQISLYMCEVNIQYRHIWENFDHLYDATICNIYDFDLCLG